MNIKQLQDIPPWDWPENTAEILLRTLRDANAPKNQRLTAAELAGDMVVINDEIVDALLAIIVNPKEPERIRGKAAISLGPVLETADTTGFEFVEEDEIPITEETFHRIQETLRNVFDDRAVPQEVRRRVLEAAVRAPQDWNSDAIRTAWSSDEQDWKVTAVFCMSYIAGFDKEIIEAIENRHPDIHFEAVVAAGHQSVDAAWLHVTELLRSPNTRKPLLLAAIAAAASIRPSEAVPLLVDLSDSDDEEVADAAMDAMDMAGLNRSIEESDEDEDEQDEDEQGFAPRA